jgi:c-di-GMP-binding flagellar brake protein YcgR/predicted transcriptional regulator
MLENLPWLVKYAILASLAVLALLFVILTIKLLYKILKFIFFSSQKPGKINSGKVINKSGHAFKKSKYKFGPLNYRRIKKTYRLKKHQMRLLSDVLKHCNVKAPKVIITNSGMGYYYFKEYLKSIQNSSMHKDEKNYITEGVLDLCKNFELSSKKFNSTRNITPGIDIVVRNEYGGSFEAKVVDVNTCNFVISFPRNLEKHYHKLEDMILSFSFSIKDDALYSFSSYITGKKTLGKNTFLEIHHTSKIFRDQRREQKRKECELPVSFYLLSVFNFEGKEKIMLHKTSQTSGYIKNISSGGMKILVTRPEGFEKGKLIKLEYRLNSRNEGVVAKIVSKKDLNYGSRSLIGVKIMRQNKSTEINTKSFVYGVSQENKAATSYSYSNPNLGGASLLGKTYLKEKAGLRY